MKRSITLILASCLILTLTLWISLIRCTESAHGQDSEDLPDQNDVKPVMIALTHLDVNDLILDVTVHNQNRCFSPKKSVSPLCHLLNRRVVVF